MRGRKNKEKGMLQGIKHRKRKKFSTLFIHRLLVVMLVEVLLLGGFVYYQKRYFDIAFSAAVSQQSMNFMSMSSEEPMEEMLHMEELQLAIQTATYGAFSYLCDPETMEILAGCEEKIFLTLENPNGGPSRIRALDTSDALGWEEYRQKVLEHKKPFRTIMEYTGYTISSQVSYAFPYKLNMQVMAYDYVEDMLGLGQGSEELFKMDLMPVPPKGYLRENLGYELQNVMIAGYSPTSPYMMNNKSSEEGYELLQTLYEDVEEKGSDEWAFEHKRIWKNGLFDRQLVNVMYVPLPNGELALILQASAINVWKNYGTEMVVVGALIMALGTLLALLTAKISYAKLKAGYDLEDYRKTLTNTMAHDLKSPLMSISGYAENLRNNLNTEKQVYYSQAILNNVQYMNGIIESVLYLSKMEDGKISLKKESLQVRAVVEKFVKEWEEKLEERELKVEIAGDIQLEADATLLEQLLSNLLDNAVKYASNNTTICVMMKDREISIQNVCEEDLRSVEDTLCQPFVVGDTSRSNQKGSGLGLAIARNICELHGFGFELICKEKSFEAKIKG